MKPVTNIDISATTSKLTATWDDLDCVDHYIMKLRKLGPIHSSEHGRGCDKSMYISKYHYYR